MLQKLIIQLNKNHLIYKVFTNGPKQISNYNRSALSTRSGQCDTNKRVKVLQRCVLTASKRERSCTLWTIITYNSIPLQLKLILAVSHNYFACSQPSLTKSVLTITKTINLNISRVTVNIPVANSLHVSQRFPKTSTCCNTVNFQY